MDQALIDRVADARWYHTLELPGGIVTPGEYDLRPLLDRIPLPASLAGRRCLDVGTRDGFWAFEMEKRQAAGVVGIDLLDHSRLDWPEPRPDLAPVREELNSRDSAFEVAREALGSRVERRELSIYDLKHSGERFDFAMLGTLLLHLRDPVGALMSLREVLTGELVLNEPISASLSVLRRRNSPSAALLNIDGPFWWLPNVAALRRYLEMAGFEVVAQGRPYMLGYGAGAPVSRIGRSGGLARSVLLRLGVPHVWMVARPLLTRS